MSSINEIAKLLGVSTTAIRKYEKKGLLSFARNRENDYREFDVMTVGMLVRIRQLRQEGFSLDEIGPMIKSMELGELRGKYTRRQAELEREIQEREALKAALETWKKDIDSIGKGLVWTEVPTYYCVKYMDNSDNGARLSEAAVKAQKYLGQMPTCFAGLYLSHDELCSTEKENYRSETAIFVPEAELEGSAPEGAHRLPGGEYVSFSHKQEKALGPSFFAPAFSEIEERGYRVCGDVFGRIFATTPAEGENQYVTWIRYFIPVEKMEKNFTKAP